MSDIKANRDTRKILDLLYKNSTPASISDVIENMYNADRFMIIYYAPPIISMLKSRINTATKSKRSSMEYWYPMLNNMLKNNSSAKRPNPSEISWEMMPAPFIIDRYEYIVTKYLLTDFGYDDMIVLNKIINTYTIDDIKYACKIGIDHNVYEIRYISAVLEKEYAKKQVHINKIKNIDGMIKSSDRLLNNTVHQHTPLDMAQAQYNWEKNRENAELIRKFNELMKNGG